MMRIDYELVSRTTKLSELLKSEKSELTFFPYNLLLRVSIKRERMNAVKKTIFINKISSIKHNHFTFLGNSEVIITGYPFVIKKASDGTRYHFDKDDLEKMSKYEKDLVPHDDGDVLSRNDYIDKIKNEFKHHIRSGNMDVILSRLYGLEDEGVELKWTGPV